MVEITGESIYSDLVKIRAANPLVLNVTNQVVMNMTANVLLAVGASPLVTTDEREAVELVALSSSVTLNMGTLDRNWIALAEATVLAAGNSHKPVVFDPVGSGASALRTNTARKLLQESAITIIRANASEVLSLADEKFASKGVDSVHFPEDAAYQAIEIARQLGVTVAISGATDVILNQSAGLRIANGHPIMPKVTGLGCSSSALCAAFLAINPDPFEAASHAMATMAIAGELAAKNMSGPGSFAANLIDRLYSLTQEEISKTLRLMP